MTDDQLKSVAESPADYPVWLNTLIYEYKEMRDREAKSQEGPTFSSGQLIQVIGESGMIIDDDGHVWKFPVRGGPMSRLLFDKPESYSTL